MSAVLVLPYLVVLLVASEASSTGVRDTQNCVQVKPINIGLSDEFCEQPFYVNLMEKTAESVLLDNICETFFPLPDDPNTYQVIMSKVYCDGSNEVVTFIATNTNTGSAKYGGPFCTFTSTGFGYAGCDTYLVHHCLEYGDCSSVEGTTVVGLSNNCKPIGLSCLRKVVEIVEASGIGDLEYWVAPMKLPSRCVTQRLCLLPPNPFYNKLPGYVPRSVSQF